MSAKWLGVKKVKLDTIVLPGGFAKRKKEQHVLELAASIRHSGVISLPVVDSKTRKLVAGGDRLAALMTLKVAQHEVRMVTGTPDELEAITLEENVRRRRGDDYDGMIKRLIQLAVIGGHELPAKVASKPAPEPEPAKVGRPKTERGTAREEVAAKLGKTPEAIRQADKRARRAEQEAEEEKIPVEVRLAEKPPITTFGVVLDVEFAKAIVAAQEQIDLADSYIRRAQGALTTLKGQGSLGGPLHHRMQAEVHQAAVAVRRERPDSVCPCCKLIPALKFTCTFCGGIGVVSVDKLANVAPELLLSGEKAVVVDGKGGFFSYARESAKPESAQKKSTAAKGARKLRIEDEHGNDLHPPDDVPAVDLTEDGVF